MSEDERVPIAARIIADRERLSPTGTRAAATAKAVLAALDARYDLPRCGKHTPALDSRLSCIYCRYEAVGAELARLREGLDAMELHDDTGDPRDEGYMAAVNEIRALLTREEAQGG